MLTTCTICGTSKIISEDAAFGALLCCLSYKSRIVVYSSTMLPPPDCDFLAPQISSTRNSIHALSTAVLML